jgi:hypothetical protein
MSKTRAICMLLLLVVACRKEQPVEKEQARQPEKTLTAEQLQVRQDLQGMAGRHNADYGWYLAFDDWLFSVEVQDILLSDRSQPLMMTALLEDVRKEEGRYYLVCDSSSSTDLFLYLKCSPSQAEYVLTPGKKNDRPLWVAVVFKPESVRHPIAEFEAEAESSASDDADAEPYAYLSVRESRTWFVKGECVDLLRIGSRYVNLQKLLNTPREGDAK